MSSRPPPPPLITFYIEWQTNDFIREIWAPRSLISAGGHTRESALAFAERGDLVAFGRLFISNVSIHTHDKCTYKLKRKKRSPICPCALRKISPSRRGTATRTTRRAMKATLTTHLLRKLFRGCSLDFITY